MAEPHKNAPVLPGKQMSSSLKERLKRAGRSYTSPYIKKLKVISPAESENGDRNLANNENAESSSKDEDSNSGAADKHFDKKSDFKPMTNSQQSQDDSCLDHPTNQSLEKSVLVSTPVSSKFRTPSTSRNLNSTEPSSSSFNSSDLLPEEEYRHIKLRIKIKEEKLRKLKLVEVHRSKYDLEKLDELTKKWKKASQTALEELLDFSTLEPKPSLTQIIDHFSLDHKMLDYNADSETFS